VRSFHKRRWEHTKAFSESDSFDDSLPSLLRDKPGDLTEVIVSMMRIR
jgi:hypothetical protein